MTDTVSIELKAIEPIKGDVLIVSSDKPLGRQMWENIKRGFDKHLPGLKVVYVDGLRVQAIRQVDINGSAVVLEVDDEQ